MVLLSGGGVVGLFGVLGGGEWVGYGWLPLVRGV